MKSKAMWALFGAAVVGLASMGQPPQPQVIQIDHDKVAAAFAKGSVTMVDTNNFKVMAGRRDAAGQVEIHELDTDIFYVLDGTATFITGGKATETSTTSPHEIRGKTITGGDTRKLVKGDIIVIPAGVPHWFTEASGPFLYYVVKVSK